MAADPRWKLKSLCPVCFLITPRKKGENWECGDCASEAIGVALEPLDEYLQKTSLKRLQKISADWRKIKGFYESYKKQKQKRIDAVVAMKQRLGV